MNSDTTPGRFQFSLRSIFVWTTVVAVLCALVAWLGATAVFVTFSVAALYLIVTGIWRRRVGTTIKGVVVLLLAPVIGYLLIRAEPMKVSHPAAYTIIPPVMKPQRVTHVIIKDTDYFLTDSQQRRTLDGKFKAGTTVYLSSKEASDYSKVESDDGIWAYVTAESLKPIESSLPAGASARTLNPAFPIVEGQYEMTANWSVFLPGKFNRRHDGGNIVLWRPGLTIWSSAWPNGYKESKEKCLAGIREHIVSPDAFDIKEAKEKDVLRLAYRLKGKAEDKRVPAFEAFVVGNSSYVSMTFFFDDEKDARVAESVWRSFKETKVNSR